MKYTLIFLATLLAIAAAQEHDSALDANEALFGTDLQDDIITDIKEEQALDTGKTIELKATSGLWKPENTASPNLASRIRTYAFSYAPYAPCPNFGAEPHQGCEAACKAHCDGRAWVYLCQFDTVSLTCTVTGACTFPAGDSRCSTPTTQKPTQKPTKSPSTEPTRAPTGLPTTPTPTHPPVTINMSGWHCGLRAGETAGNCKLGDCKWQCTKGSRGKPPPRRPV